MLTDLIRSIIEKVQSIINSKSNIRASIINKEVAVPEEAKLSEMPAYIDQIETDGINTSDATATEAEILAGYSAYARNEILHGTLEKQEKTVTPTKNGFDVTPDEGKLLSKVTLEAIKSGELSVPVIELEESTGLITATSNFSEGYSSNASKKDTLQLSTQKGKDITPSTTDQTAILKGKFATGDIKVKGDGNLRAENIKKDIKIFNVTGTYTESDVTEDRVSLRYSEGEITLVDGSYSSPPKRVNIILNQAISSDLSGVYVINASLEYFENSDSYTGKILYRNNYNQMNEISVTNTNPVEHSINSGKLTFALPENLLSETLYFYGDTTNPITYRVVMKF